MKTGLTSQKRLKINGMARPTSPHAGTMANGITYRNTIMENVAGKRLSAETGKVGS